MAGFLITPNKGLNTAGVLPPPDLRTYNDNFVCDNVFAILLTQILTVGLVSSV